MIEQRLAKLEAEADIRRLKARYLNACDAKNVEQMRGCFTQDAVIDFAGMGQFSLDELMAIYNQMAVQTPIADSHHGHNAEIDILSEDEAKAVWNLGFTTYDPRDHSFRVMSLFYYDEYRRLEGGWRISASKTEARLVVQGRLDAETVRAETVIPTLQSA